MEHIKKLNPKNFKVDEYQTKDGNTSAIVFEINSDTDELIEGRLTYDWVNEEGNKNIVTELWWDEECFRRCHNVVQTQNQLSLLIKRRHMPNYGFKSVNEIREFQRSESLIEI